MENDFQPWSQKTSTRSFFSRKIKNTSHSPLNFNNNSVQQVQFQKHLSVYLDVKLDFRKHLQNTFKKINKTISLLRKLQNNLLRAPLVTIYKSFVRPHVDHRDISYNQTFNSAFHERLVSIQYNAALVITGVIWGSSREALSRTRLWILAATPMVQETFSLFQNYKKSISQVTLWFNTNC